MNKKKRPNQRRELPSKQLVEKHYSSEDESSEEDEDSMAMVARGLKKIFK